MFNPTFFKLHKTQILLTLLSIAFYVSFAYGLVRTDYTKLLLLYSALFFLFYKLVQTTKWNFKFLVVVALIFRLVFLLALPNLSQDFYRFIWDGRIIFEGLNPYLYTPKSFIISTEFPIAQAQELYKGMGELNGSHYTNYPPVKQFIFAIAALFAGKSIIGSAIVFRIFIIAADFGTLYFGKKLLDHFNLPVHRIFWYVLNPFIIIELTGSLHFEGIMIFFLVWSLYLLHLEKWKLAGIVFALSISVKLIPLLFLPLFYQWFVKGKSVRLLDGASIERSVNARNDSNSEKKPTGHKNLGFGKLVGFYVIILTTTILLFAPFLSSEFIHNYSETVGLWFGKFEFNASLYYVARAIGYAITGYNEIGIIGKFIPIIVVVILLLMTYLKTNKTIPQLINAMLLISTIYYFTSTTIHPWYLATLVILSVFSNYKFPLVWSFMAILTYFAYANANNSENLWLIGLEYTVVYSVFIWEVFIKKSNSQKPLLSS